MFRKAKNTTVLGGNFTVVNEEGFNGRQILSQSPYVVHGAIHDSGERYPPSECHPGTREDILNIALGWVDKPLDESESQIFWLSGPAGVGKTAIAQSFCQCLKELGRLGGDFFLSRSVAGHSDLHTLFPTLAYQLAEVYPEFGNELDGVIKTNAFVLRKNMEIQLEKLIVNPLKRATRNKSDIPLVVVIDGLDEAGGERDQALFLRLLDSSFIGHRYPLKIFLTSRPEPWIKSAFGANLLVDNTRSHFLHRTSQTDIDIRNVLESGFANIQNTHDLMKGRSDPWPSSEIIDEIVDRASGQFIYATTLLRYVEDPNGNPVERLHRIVQMSSKMFMDSPFLALDNLYKHVLSTSSNLDRTLTILGAVIATFQIPVIPPLPYVYSSIAALGLREHKRLPMEIKIVSLSNASIHNQSIHSVVPLPSIDNQSIGSIAPLSSIDSQNIVERIPVGPPLDGLTAPLPIDRIEQILNFPVADGTLALRTIQSLVEISSGFIEVHIKFYHKSFQDFLLDPNRSGEYFVDMGEVCSKLMVGTLRLIRDFEQCKTISGREGMYRNLAIVDARWVDWWLRSAASDQDQLLAQVKALAPLAFYRLYAWNIARNVPFRSFKALREKYSGEGSRNVVELLTDDSNGRKAFPLFFKRARFLAVAEVLDKYLRHAIHTDPRRSSLLL